MTRVLAVFLVCALVLLGIQTHNVGKLRSLLTKQELAFVAEKAAMERVKLAEIIKLNEVKNAAIQESEKRAKINERHAVAAKSELDGLRIEIERIRSESKLPGNCSTENARVETLAAVFSECSSRLEEMARKADGHLNDALSARSD